MRKPITLIAIAVAVGAVAALAAAGGHAGATDATTTMRVAIAFGLDPRIDVGRRGPSAGDAHVLADRLLRNGREVGHTGGSCLLTGTVRPEEACTMTFSLAGGIVTGQWLNTPPVHKVIAVTGGTGIYRDARGEIRVTELSPTRGTALFVLTAVRQ